MINTTQSADTSCCGTPHTHDPSMTYTEKPPLLKTITLRSCDVLLYVDEGKGLKSIISRWGIGLYNHVSLYIGRLGSLPFLYESEGRGVSIQNLQHQTGRLVVVMRLSDVHVPVTHKLVMRAIEIASDANSYYDYLAIVHSCLPRVLKEKWPWLPVPPKYHRDASMICSEAVAEVFWQSGIDVVSREVIPLPVDFATSPVLRYIGTGRMLVDVLPGQIEIQ